MKEKNIDKPWRWPLRHMTTRIYRMRLLHLRAIVSNWPAIEGCIYGVPRCTEHPYE